MTKLTNWETTVSLFTDDYKVPLLPPELAAHHLTLISDGHRLVYTYDTHAERTGITSLLNDLNNAGIRFKDLNTKQSSLEDIFVGIVSGK